MAGKETDYYYPGDLIYVGKPFISCIEKSVQKHICGHCLSRGGNLKFCGSCRVTKYCSKVCQKQAWPDHKFECLFLKNLADEESDALIHLAAKIIMKLKDKDWSLITE
ncbi:SET and MYND domain-containing protein 3, partial [Stegodyphus mimosarum]